MKNQDANNKDLPVNILLEKWADIGFFWQGAVPVLSFERLSKNLNPAEQNECVKDLDIKVNLQKKDGILWLSYEVAGCLMTLCQRCLEAMTIDVTGASRLAILFDVAQIEQVCDDEYVLVDELSPDAARKVLPLRDLLEDELLLALPLSLRHTDCDTPIEMAVYEKIRQSPFAALAELKDKLN